MRTHLNSSGFRLRPNSSSPCMEWYVSEICTNRWTIHRLKHLEHTSFSTWRLEGPFSLSFLQVPPARCLPSMNHCQSMLLHTFLYPIKVLEFFMVHPTFTFCNFLADPACPQGPRQVSGKVHGNPVGCRHHHEPENRPISLRHIAKYWQAANTWWVKKITS